MASQNDTNNDYYQYGSNPELEKRLGVKSDKEKRKTIEIEKKNEQGQMYQYGSNPELEKRLGVNKEVEQKQPSIIGKAITKSKEWFKKPEEKNESDQYEEIKEMQKRMVPQPFGLVRASPSGSATPPIPKKLSAEEEKKANTSLLNKLYPEKGVPYKDVHPGGAEGFTKLISDKLIKNEDTPRKRLASGMLKGFGQEIDEFTTPKALEGLATQTVMLGQLAPYFFGPMMASSATKNITEGIIDVSQGKEKEGGEKIGRGTLVAGLLAGGGKAKAKIEQRMGSGKKIGEPFYETPTEKYYETLPQGTSQAPTIEPTGFKLPQEKIAEIPVSEPVAGDGKFGITKQQGPQEPPMFKMPKTRRAKPPIVRPEPSPILPITQPLQKEPLLKKKVKPQKPQKPQKAYSLVNFIRDSGGLWDPYFNSEIKRFGDIKEGGMNLKNKKTGSSLDRMRMMANENDYGPYETTSDFIEAIRQDTTAIKQGEHGKRLVAPEQSGEFYNQLYEDNLKEQGRLYEENKHTIPVTLTTGNLNLAKGDKVKVEGEWLKVKESTDERLVLKDGKEIEVDSVFGQIPVEGGEEFGIKRTKQPTEQPLSIDEFSRQAQTEAKRQKDILLAQQGMERLQKPRPEQKPVDEGLFEEGQDELFSGISGEIAANLPKRDQEMHLTPAPDYKSQKPIGAYDVVQEIAKIWNTPVRLSKFRTHTKTGYRSGIYKPKSEVIRIDVANDIPTAAHEIGHWFDYSTPVKQMRSRKFAFELMPLDYNKKRADSGEGFAEFIRLYLTNNNVAKQVAPRFYDAFNSFLSDQPHLKDMMTRSKDLVELWNKQGAENRMKGQMASLGEKPRKSYLTTPQRLKLQLRSAFTDTFAVLDFATKQMVGERKIAPAKDPYKLALYSLGSSARSRANLLFDSVDFAGRRTGDSLKTVLSQIKDADFENFLNFAYSKIAVERLKQGRNPGIGIDEAKFVYDKYKDFPFFEDTATAWAGWYDRLLDYTFQAANIDKVTLDKIRGSTSYYLPLTRLIDDSIGSLGGSRKSFLMPGQAVKRMSKTGSGRKVKDFIQQAINMSERMVAVADKTRVGNALVDLAMDSPKGKWWIREIATPMEAHKVTIGKLQDVLAKDMKEIFDLETDRPVGKPSKEELESLKEEFDESGKEGKSELKDEFREELDQVVTYFSNAIKYKGGEPIITQTRNGKTKFYEVDPTLYEAMHGMDTVELKGMMKFVDAIGNIPKQVVVLGATGLRASFTIMNAMRDALMSVITSQKQGIGAVGRHAKAYGDIARRSEAYKQWRATGGEMFNQVREDQKQLNSIMGELRSNTKAQKALNIIKNPLDFYKSLVSVSESATRVGEFKLIRDRMEKEGKWTAEDIAVESSVGASDVTLNFKRAGYVMKWLNRYVPFLNPWTQGWSKTYRTFTGKNWKQSAAAGFKYITLPAIALYLLNRKDKDYDEQPWWRKTGFLSFKLSPEGTRFNIPLPQDAIGFMFASFPTALLESIDKQDRTYLDEVSKQWFRNSVLPPYMFAFAAPVMEWWANKSIFTGRPIENLGQQRLMPEYRTNEWTDPLIEEIGMGLGISPAKLNQALRTATGGLGTDITNMSKYFMTDKTVTAERPKEKADIPVVGRFFERKNKAGRSIDDYFDKYKQQEMVHDTAMSEFKKTKSYEERQKIADKYGYDKHEYKKLKKYYDGIIDALRKKDFQTATDLARKALGKEE